VAGLLLLDPAHEDDNAYMPEQLNETRCGWDPDQVLPEELPGEIIEFYRGLLRQEMTGWPEEISNPRSRTCSAGNSRATRLPPWTKRPHAAP
jgi:hypothetical protein